MFARRGWPLVAVVALLGCGGGATASPTLAYTPAHALDLMRGNVTFDETVTYTVNTDGLTNVRPEDVASFGGFMRDAGASAADGRQQSSSLYAMTVARPGCAAMVATFSGGTHYAATVGGANHVDNAPQPLPIAPAELAALIGSSVPTGPAATPPSVVQLTLSKSASRALTAAGVSLSGSVSAVDAVLAASTQSPDATGSIVVATNGDVSVTVTVVDSVDFAALTSALSGNSAHGAGTPGGTLRITTAITLRTHPTSSVSPIKVGDVAPGSLPACGGPA